MEGDPRNPRVSLLKKYDIPIDHLSYEYVEKCTDKKELERIIRILRSGEEGSYPDLLNKTEERLRLFAPESRVLRVEVPILTKDSIPDEEWSAVEKELLSWEKEIRVMDKCLEFEKDRIKTTENHTTPGVRKVVQPAAKCAHKKTKEVKLDNQKDRIKSGDYSAWDKFDVDKELLKMDVEEERRQEGNEKKKLEAKKQLKEKKIQVLDVNKESYSATEQQVLANQAKDRGNECYRTGDLETALKYYEISIKLHPSANGYNNRAITYLKLKQYENALNDCNKVLELDKDNVKGLHRRATAYQNLSNENNNYNELALSDLSKIIRLEPNNKIAQNDLQVLKKKLNIEDEGKKFRMPIFENENACKEIDVEQTETEEKSLWSIKDCFIDKLPLTYYGPSTSTFQCEPYSMAHRALSSGSVFSGQVLCKCNSNRARQNPLCQKCGEEMCRPKRVYKAIESSSSDTISAMKKENEAINRLIKEQEHKTQTNDLYGDVVSDSNDLFKSNRCEFKIEEVGNTVEEPNQTEEKISEGEKDCDGKEDSKDQSNEKSKRNEVINAVSTENISTDKPVIKIESTLIDKSACDDEVIVDEENHRKTNELNLSSDTIIDKETVQRSTNEGNKFSEDEKLDKPSKVDNLKSDVVAGAVVEKISRNEVRPVQSGSRPTSRRSKNRKKSKEMKKIIAKYSEPVKVVHAAKYLHPTSVEPKVKNEIARESHREINVTTNSSFKAFVPNKKCVSEHGIRLESASESGSGNSKRASECVDSNSEIIERVNSELSLEGNKENISENTSQCNKSDGRGGKEVSDEEVKREKVESAFEFIKSWEELKKMDVTYAKRAEIIRLLNPSDLRKVIGIKLDSEILSSLLECLERHFIESDPKIVLEFLKHLPELPRFGLISMFLEEKEKKVMRRLVETAEGKGFTLDEDVKRALTISS